VSEKDEFDAILESLVESGTCSKETAAKIRLARKAGDALGRKRSRFLLAATLLVLAPAFAGIACTSLPSGIKVACGFWAAFSAIAGLVLALTAAEMPS
jgi:hypothetical protein